MLPKSQVDPEPIVNLQEHLDRDTPEIDADKWLEALTRQLYGNLNQEPSSRNKQRRKSKRQE
jgi:hypothetical protein